MPRLKWIAAWCVCLLPILWAATSWTWTPPWQDGELHACAGDYELPSGLHFRVRSKGDHLTAGQPPIILERAAAGFYVNTTHGMRLKFERKHDGPASAVILSGMCPSTTARRVNGKRHCPSQRVFSGGPRLRLLTAGGEHDGPTVIIETGALGSLEGVAGMQGEVARFAQVVAYDHPGTGGSDPCECPQHALTVAELLHAALRNASLEPPYILVGMSLGGPYTQVFADRFPDDVAALVWIDPTPDWQQLEVWCDRHAPEFYPRVRRSLLWADTFMETRFHNSPEPGRLAAWEALGGTWQQVRKAGPLPDVPITQITGAKDQDSKAGVGYKVRFFSDWLETHAPNAEHVLATESGHDVYATQPQLVLDAIRDIARKAEAP